jgi:uncharacterized protein (DUF58 family)
MRLPIYPTNRAIAMAAAGVPLSLVPGAIMPSLWVVGFAWLALALLLTTADALLCVTGTIPTLRIQTPATLQVGLLERVTVRVDFSGAPPAAVEMALGTSERIGTQPARHVGRPGEAFDFVLSPQRRGEASIDQLWARWRGPLGLIWRQRTEVIGKQVPVLINTRAAQDMAARLSRSFLAGASMAHDIGVGGELNALVEFTSGSDRRMIDWKQSARHGSLLTREYRAERSTRIMLAIDAGRVMSEQIGGMPRIDHGLTSALALAYAALKDGDRVGLLSFDSAPRVVSALTSGTHAFNGLQRLAAKIDYSNEETDFAAGVTSMLNALERRTIVVVFTDFSDSHAADRMVESLARLLGKHAVLFVAFRDDDVERIADGEPIAARDVARAVVAGAMLRERRAVFDRLHHLGAHVVELRPKDATPLLLSRYMRLKREFM